MKTSIRILSLAVLALAMAACSNDMEQPTVVQPAPGNAGEGIPFSATISTGSATTRALKEDTDEGTIISTWAKDEQVALIHNGVVDVMTAGEPDENGNVTITGTLSVTPKNGDDVTVVYPASAVDATTKAVKADLLTTQGGTLTTIASSLNLRQSDGATFKVGELTATLNGTVTLANQIAIVKFSLSDGNNALKTTELTISDGSKTITVKPSEAASDLYVAMAPTSGSGANYSFSATVGSETYTYSKTGVILAAGTYYHSPIKMDKVLVVIPVSSLTLDPETLTMTIGDEATVAATVNSDATTKTVTWSVSEGTAVTVDQTGKVTAVAAGDATITAKAGEKTATCTVTVSKKAGSISFQESTVNVDNTASPFTNTLTNTGDGAVTYKSSDDSVAEVDADGKVTLMGTGTGIIITATVADSDTYHYDKNKVSYTLNVSALPSNIAEPIDYGHEDSPF